MELVKSKERSEHPLSDVSPLSSRWGGASSNRIEDSTVEVHDAIVEHAWLLKSQMRWVRDDRNPLNSVRWLVWDRWGTGNPPSRVEKKSHSRREPWGSGPAQPADSAA
jgi:hypothetical protein